MDTLGGILRGNLTAELTGGRRSGEERARVAGSILAHRVGDGRVRSFHAAMESAKKDMGGVYSAMYPLFFLPPWNGGKKARTLTGALPGTLIFSANEYEFEALCALFLLCHGNGAAGGIAGEVAAMVSRTAERQKLNCFGRFCAAGECFEASVSAARFYAVTSTRTPEVLGERTKALALHWRDRKRPRAVLAYYALALSDIYAYLMSSGADTEPAEEAVRALAPDMRAALGRCAERELCDILLARALDICGER